MLVADFARMIPRLRPDRLRRELLVRAARVKGAAAPTALDATAGLGEDALLLAAAGFHVRLYERDATIAALLADGLKRARAVPELSEVVARMELVEADSVEAMRAMAAARESCEVVFLDPMFPAKRKSAAVKKKLQLIQGLERPCEDEESLLAAARAVASRKVVAKRPVKGPALAGCEPSYTLAGKAIRYDVIVRA